MLISYKHRFLFIHTPKTGGTSIQRVLRPYADCPKPNTANRLLGLFGIHANLFTPERERRFRKHVSAIQVQRQLSGNVYENLFKFAFVRNPWDRMVSRYHFILEHPEHHRHRRVRSMRGFRGVCELGMPS